MEIGGNNININSMLGHHNSAIGGTSTRGQNGNSTPNLAWDICGELNTNNSNTTTTRTNNNNNNNSNLWYSAAAAAAATTLATAAEEAYAGGPHSSHQQYYHPDPHLMCLKLGKRHYFEDASSSAAAPPPPPPLIHRHVEGFPLAVAVAAAAGKRGKQQQQLYGGGGGGGGGGALSSKVARCQVEGCHVALVNAKEYHRRHKVCEMHSKASKVVVLGMEQRFCQQCSRFHVVSEFDESKRSCRRRLAGHNERRRKSSHDSLPRNSSQDNKLMGASRFPAYLSSSSTGRVLSLLSSKADSGVSPSDLSSRSSAALRELIAENRAAIWARQLISDRSAEEYFGADHGQSWSNSVESHHHHNQMYCDPHDHGWERFHESSIGSHLTLDLMQTPSPAGYGFLPANARAKTKAEEEECDLWNSFQGASMV